MLKGELYIPEIVPDTLKWTKSDPMNILKVQTDTKWQLVEKLKEKATRYTPASGTVAIDHRHQLNAKQISCAIFAVRHREGIRDP